MEGWEIQKKKQTSRDVSSAQENGKTLQYLVWGWQEIIIFKNKVNQSFN